MALPTRTPRPKRVTSQKPRPRDASASTLGGQPETTDPAHEALSVPSREFRGSGSKFQGFEPSEAGTGKG